jgi:hypothetical protein
MTSNLLLFFRASVMAWASAASPSGVGTYPTTIVMVACSLFLLNAGWWGSAAV